MNYIKAIACLFTLLAGVALADLTVGGKKVEPLKLKKSIEISAEYTQEVIQFGAGDKTVTINVKTGRVRYGKMNPDAAARLFWDAVVLAWPEIKDRVIKEHEAKR